MEHEIQISGNIYFSDMYTEGGEYTIRVPGTGQGWGLPTRNIEPDDLRKMADHLEKIRGLT